MPLSALKFHFFYKLPFFRRDYANTYTYPHTLRFSDICLKNERNTFFLKLLFFPLYSFSLPPKHFLIIFSGKLATKNGQKPPERRKKLFSFFYNFFTFFLSPYGKKQNNLLFPPFLSLEIEKSQGKTSHKKFFFFI